MEQIAQEAGIGLLYGIVGIILLGLGYLVVDLLTPGKLGKQILEDRNVGAVVVTVSQLLGVGIVVASAILGSERGIGNGLISTALYGVIGIALMGVAFLILDVVTPGKLGDLLMDETTHPAIWVVGASNLATATIVAAAIS